VLGERAGDGVVVESDETDGLGETVLLCRINATAVSQVFSRVPVLVLTDDLSNKCHLFVRSYIIGKYIHSGSEN